jgi:hypothetical protein
MKKNIYQKPAVCIVNIHAAAIICVSPSPQAYDRLGNTEVQFSRQNDGWSDDDE